MQKSDEPKSQALATIEPPSQALIALQDRWGVNTQELAVIKRELTPGATDSEFVVFMNMAAIERLNPFVRPPLIWFYKRNPRDPDDKPVITPSIHGFRAIANRHPDYEGETGPFWCGPDGKWVDVWLAKEPPLAAKVGVYRRGYREPFWGLYYLSAAPRNREGDIYGLWKHDAARQLAKCAEAEAIRKAFQEDEQGQRERAEREAARNQAIAPDPELAQWLKDHKRDTALYKPPGPASPFPKTGEAETDEWLAMQGEDFDPGSEPRIIDPATGEILDAPPVQAPAADTPAPKAPRKPARRKEPVQESLGLLPDEAIPMPPPPPPKRELTPEQYWRGRWAACRDDKDVAKYWADMKNSIKEGECPGEVWNKLRKEFGPKP